ncbi:12730_t:CDS:2, partial [Racocetra persica]
MTLTLGIQSTSFVKSQNACIKQVLENSNTSLYDLGNVLMERSKEEQKRKQFEEWRQSIPSTASVVTVFPLIESLVKRYLRPNVSHFLIEQMKESLYYAASLSTIKKVESLTVYETSQNKDIDVEFDAVYLSAKYLLDHLEQNTIAEIWKVSRVTSHRINHFIFLLADGSYGCTCLLQQRKDAAKEYLYSGKQFNELANDVNIIQESNECRFMWLQPFIGNETGNTMNEEFVDKVLFYRKVWGLACTAVNKCMLHRNHEFISLIESYLEKIHASEDELVEEVTTDQNTTENIERKPKSASHDKNVVTTTQEKGIKKHRQYTCGF